jgi:hypothetical protein
MQKQDWIQHIETHLASQTPFVIKYTEEDKSTLIFACDTFRRRKHCVSLHFEPTNEGLLSLHVTIMPLQTSLEITVKRDDNVEDITRKLNLPYLTDVTIRGCGTVINLVCRAVEYSIHNGWFVEKSFMNTLVQVTPENVKQRNTTLSIYLKRGSYLGTI